MRTHENMQNQTSDTKWQTKTKVWQKKNHIKWMLPNIAWKVSIFGVFLVRNFPHSNWLRGDTEYYGYGHFSRSENAGKFSLSHVKSITLIVKTARNLAKNSFIIFSSRSIRLQMFFKKGALKNVANFTRKHLRWSLF